MIVGSDGLQGETDRGNCLGLWVFGCVACSAHSLLGCRVLSEMDPYIWLEKMVTLKGKWVNKTESQGVEAEATVEVPAHRFPSFSAFPFFYRIYLICSITIPPVFCIFSDF